MPRRNTGPKTGKKDTAPESKLRSKPPAGERLRQQPAFQILEQGESRPLRQEEGLQIEQGESRPLRPPVVPFAVSVALMGITIWLFTAPLMEVPIPGTQKALNRDAYGYIVGSFLSTMSLAVFLRSDGQARATMRYSDWKLLPARSLVPWITGVNWMLGATHLFFWAAELTRPVQ